MHFSVLVIGQNPDEKLAPYQENNMCDCPQEYLSFQPEIEFKDGETARQQIILHHEEIPEEKRNEKYEEELAFYKSGSVAEVIEKYHGYKFSKEHNAWGYEYNPNSMWDWYEVGGRWCGFFPCIKGMEHLAVKSRGHWGGRQTFPFEYDSIIKKAIDFDAFEDFYFNNAEKFCEKNKYKIQTGIYGVDTVEAIKQNAQMYVRSYLNVEWEENRKDNKDWDKYLLEKIKEQDDDELITIVDCHI